MEGGLVSAPDGGDDRVGVLGPAEGTRVGIGLLQEAVDGGLEGNEEWKTPRFSRRLVSLAKKHSTALIHEAEVGVKWKV
jgi:hypothetical protein